MSFSLRPWLLVFALAVSLYAVSLFMLEQDLLASALTRLISWQGLLAGLLCLLSYMLRGWRWIAWMKLQGRVFSPLQGMRFYLAGYAFTPTPGNVGEAARGLMPSERPLSLGSSLAIYGAERLADLLCLLLLAIPAGAMLLSAIPIWLASLPVLALALAAYLLGARRWRPLLLARLPWIAEAWTCLATRPSVWIGQTSLAWTLQGLAIWLLCLLVLDVPVSLLQAISIYALSMVGGALSMLPAGLGGTEAILLALWLGTGATLGLAVILTVMARLLTLWFAVALGAICLFYSVLIRKDLRFSSP